MTGTGWNPRYLLFAQAHGHRPEEQMDIDYDAWPGGLMTGFICWMGERWREFCQVQGVRNPDQARLKLGEKTDAIFDRWLSELPAKTTRPKQ